MLLVEIENTLKTLPSLEGYTSSTTEQLPTEVEIKDKNEKHSKRKACSDWPMVKTYLELKSVINSNICTSVGPLQAKIKPGALLGNKAWGKFITYSNSDMAT